MQHPPCFFIVNAHPIIYLSQCQGVWSILNSIHFILVLSATMQRPLSYICADWSVTALFIAQSAWGARKFVGIKNVHLNFNAHYFPPDLNIRIVLAMFFKISIRLTSWKLLGIKIPKLLWSALSFLFDTHIAGQPDYWFVSHILFSTHDGNFLGKINKIWWTQFPPNSLHFCAFFIVFPFIFLSLWIFW